MGVVVAVSCAAVAGAVGGVWWARRRFVVVLVSGSSMRPTYRPGDRVLVRRTGPRGPRRGDVVVLPDPQRALRPTGVRGRPGRPRWVIKRATAIAADGRLAVHGDNPGQSTDSRQYGLVPADTVLGTVVGRL
jgi:signal peptidase I